MSPDAQKDRMNRVVENGKINGPALAQLIDECGTAAKLFLEKNEGVISEKQRNTLQDVLNETDGKSIVANMADDTDAAWLLELKERVLASGLSVKNLKEL